MAKMDIAKKKCTTPVGRLSFPYLFQKQEFDEGEPKFGATLLFPKKTDLAAMKKAVINAAVEKWGSKENWPKGLRMPFRDGDEKTDLKGYPGNIYVKATSKQRPGVIDREKHPISEDDDAIYPGCYARATLIAFAYEKKGNKGVSFSLQNVQKVKEGERFGGRRSADDDFEDDLPEDALDASTDSEEDSDSLGLD